MQKVPFLDRNVVLRIVKPYPQARNHVYTGRVVDYDGNFVVVDGCVLHFGRPSAEDPAGGLTTSPLRGPAGNKEFFVLWTTATDR